MEPVRLEVIDVTDQRLVTCPSCGDPTSRPVKFLFAGQRLFVCHSCQKVMDWAHRVCRGKEMGVEVPPAVWQAVMASVWDRLDRRDNQGRDEGPDEFEFVDPFQEDAD